MFLAGVVEMVQPSLFGLMSRSVARLTGLLVIRDRE